MLPLFFRYLSPKAHIAFANASSGFVPLLLLDCIHFLRCSGVNLSIS
ncbi:Uncharacterised protein [Neisseria meningitidis]|uniref:Uncharacterized protein n=1 Tax=Neisseria meningitidis TaxID=487 RepID=A0AAD2J6R1_NEIME|nr:hypothetical protein B6116_01079 [Neisseria meningitidis]ELK59502.1 hypothetical protein NM87255_0709 [Neisseria meningitidis 87255]ELK61305.1 hypothetical protein NM98080_0673 [Neisseria meningitidis 98080]ELK84709.1 hypothetical protein NMNM586_0732 [Neisseria meningitidis NM586]ELK86648.1 hypothetical protein NMNM762_0691 [Neisseria meningitidis NM762]ELK90002.1 hypothetical protein NMM7124_0818 [Neisseria meningitidis M7124]ELK91416.1 hypothetical protein NMNM174_0723 [Neisseria mening